MTSSSKSHRMPGLISRAAARVRRTPRMVVVLALAGFVCAALLVWLGVQDRETAQEAQQTVQATQDTLDQVADPLAALCAADPSVRARVGDACDTAQQVVEAPMAIEPGAQGDAGRDGRGITATVIDADGHLIVSYTDGSRIDVGPVVGRTGSAGRGIVASVLSDGRLILTFSDGSTQDVGAVVGPMGTAGVAGDDGDPGRGIVSTDIVDGRLVVAYTDGSTEDAGPVPAGPPGTDGSPAAELVINRSDGTTVRCPRTGGEDTAPVYTCSAA